MDFIKLSQIDNFTVEKVWGYKFKKWDDINKKMLTSDTWIEGYAKKWDIDTNKGKLDISNSQFAQMLVGCYNSKTQSASVVGRTFSVKTNGKQGLEIRYYINPMRETQTDRYVDTEQELSSDEIPF